MTPRGELHHSIVGAAFHGRFMGLLEPVDADKRVLNAQDKRKGQLIARSPDRRQIAGNFDGNRPVHQHFSPHSVAPKPFLPADPTLRRQNVASRDVYGSEHRIWCPSATVCSANVPQSIVTPNSRVMAPTPRANATDPRPPTGSVAPFSLQSVRFLRSDLLRARAAWGDARTISGDAQ